LTYQLQLNSETEQRDLFLWFASTECFSIRDRMSLFVFCPILLFLKVRMVVGGHVKVKDHVSLTFSVVRVSVIRVSFLAENFFSL
jgi:hypothetical protein